MILIILFILVAIFTIFLTPILNFSSIFSTKNEDFKLTENLFMKLCYVPHTSLLTVSLFYLATKLFNFTVKIIESFHFSKNILIFYETLSSFMVFFLTFWFIRKWKKFIINFFQKNLDDRKKQIVNKLFSKSIEQVKIITSFVYCTALLIILSGGWF